MTRWTAAGGVSQTPPKPPSLFNPFKRDSTPGLLCGLRLRHGLRDRGPGTHVGDRRQLR